MENCTTPDLDTKRPELVLIADHLTQNRRDNNRLQVIAEEKEDEDIDGDERSCGQRYKEYISRKIRRHLPIVQWLPKYSTKDAVGDLIAGITVGLTVVPQGLAYGHLAGLPPQHGLYGAFMGCFVYAVLGTCKYSTIGSTAIASLLTFQIAQGVWQKAVMLTFLTGCLEIAMALFRLGFLVDFVSTPVSAGFTSAVALIVATSQLKIMLGVRGEGSTFLHRWISMFKDIQNVKLHDALLGFLCVIVLLLLRQLGRLRFSLKEEEEEVEETEDREYTTNTYTSNKGGTSTPSFIGILNKILWFVGVMRNAAVVIICTLVAMNLDSQGNNYFTLTGQIPEGLPTFALPPFSIDMEYERNKTDALTNVQMEESFLDILKDLSYGLLIVPMIAMLENIAVCKAFAKGNAVDATQELFAIGVANVANSFFQGYRGNSGLARSSVNHASGVRTPLANVYIGLVVILALIYLTKYFYYIPLTVLGAIIFSAIIFQIQYGVLISIWRSKRSDLIPGLLAFVSCLVLPLEMGVLIAITINCMSILYNTARPRLESDTLESCDGVPFIRISLDRCLLFPSAEFARKRILKLANIQDWPVVIDCTYVYDADYTSAKVIAAIIEDFYRRQQPLIFFNVKPRIAKIFRRLSSAILICYNVESLSKSLKNSTIYSTSL